MLAVTCGANMDFSQLAVIAAEAGISGETRRHLRFEIAESSGSMLELMQDILKDCNIVEFQYGKSATDVAYPIIGIDAPVAVVAEVIAACEAAGIKVEEVSAGEDVVARVINYDPSLFARPHAALRFPRARRCPARIFSTHQGHRQPLLFQLPLHRRTGWPRPDWSGVSFRRTTGRHAAPAAGRRTFESASSGFIGCGGGADAEGLVLAVARNLRQDLATLLLVT